MNILVTGSGGKAGSWAVRGEQLGRAIGATVLANAIDIAPFDLAVIVKRPPPDLLRRIREAAVPMVWDIVDAWPQPDGNRWSEAECKAWLAHQVDMVRPDAIVAATRAMADDCAGFGVPVLALPHHATPGQGVNPIRETVQRVGYQGSWRYIEAWGPWLGSECARRGWEWEPEADDLVDLDIVVAVRDQDGYAPMYWKSGVKAANAMATGTPLICSCEFGAIETAGSAATYVTTHKEMAAALDRLTSKSERMRSAQRLLLSATPTLESVAATYKDWLHALRL